MNKLILPSDYHGIHVPPPLKDYEKLVWHEPRASDKYRVREHTCECKALGTVFELCAAGGLLFIRKSYRDFSDEVVEESERWINIRAKKMWFRLITGQAR